MVAGRLWPLPLLVDSITVCGTMGSSTRILVLFAHPALQKSRVNAHLIRAATDLPHVTFHDLYEAYPDFQIDVPHEQALLTEHDIVVLQHPFYWYSIPALLKEWIDLVLQYGFAFGSHGLALQDKGLMQVITMGGGAQTYTRDGMNRYTVRELLAPLEQTAHLCHMRYLAPFVVQGTHRHALSEDIEPYAQQYRELLVRLSSGELSTEELQSAESANDQLPRSSKEQAS